MDAYDHCAAVVRAGDRDRYLADLFAPAAARRHLSALHAFAVEVARVSDMVSEPMPGEIRLQWWRDAIGAGDAGHPVARALNETIAEFGLPRSAFDALLTARIFDLYHDPMPTLTDLEGYAGDTRSSLMQLGAMILAGGKDPRTAALAGFAGVAQSLAQILHALPRDAARRQCYLPADLLRRHNVDIETMFAGKATPELRAALAELRALARERLQEARALVPAIERTLLPAFLPAALVEPLLARLERSADPLRDAVALSPIARQWRLWRAARRGRI